MKRIQRKRTKGWKMPKNTVYVGRPSRWGNPYRVGELTHNRYPVTNGQAVAFFKEYIKDKMLEKEIRTKLRGKNLACWCKTSDSCHADALLKIANEL